MRHGYEVMIELLLGWDGPQWLEDERGDLGLSSRIHAP